MRFPRLLPALLLFASACSLPAQELAQKITFAAMNHPDPAVVPAVQTLMRTGFMEQLSHLVRTHVEQCAGVGAELGEKIECFARSHIQENIRIHYGNSGTRRPGVVEIRTVQFTPGERFAEVGVRFSYKGDSGVSPAHCRGTMTVDTKIWKVSKFPWEC